MNSIKPTIKNDLLSNESVIWDGRPDPEITFTSNDLFLVPFSILWGGFAIVWEATVVYQLFVKESTRSGEFISYLFPLFGIPFVAMGLYFIFGRFIYKKKSKLKTWYYLTNKRALIYNFQGGKKFNSVDLSSLSNISMTTRSEGSGMIKFGPSSFRNDLYSNTGMDFFSALSGPSSPAFHDIHNVEKVYRTVMDIQQKLKS